MKITPLDIKQKSFEKKAFGGVDKDEVSAFLSSLASAWEKMQDENRELRFKLDAAEKENAKMREVERSLFLTLKNAEETGINMIEQSTKKAELNIQEAQMKAESLLREARWQAKAIVENAETDARKAVLALQQEIKNLETEYNNMEAMRENMVAEIKSLSHDIIEKLDRFSRRKTGISISHNQDNGKAITGKPITLGETSQNNSHSQTRDHQARPVKLPRPSEPLPKPDENEPKSPGTVKGTGSFFDQL